MLLKDLDPEHRRLSHRHELEAYIHKIRSLPVVQQKAVIASMKQENETFEKALIAKTKSDIAALFVEQGKQGVIRPYLDHPLHELYYRIEQSIRYNSAVIDKIESLFSDDGDVAVRSSFSARYPKMQPVKTNKNARHSYSTIAPKQGKFSTQE